MSINKDYIKSLIQNNPEPIIFEIGAADGLDTLEFIRCFDNLNFKIFCFEPDPRNIESFKKTINDNRVVLIEGAVGDQDGVCNFFQSSTIYSSSLKEPTENLFKEWPIIKFENKLTIQTYKLDTFIQNNNIDCVDFIWADVQGVEDLLIKGGEKSFMNKIKFLYTEYSNMAYYKTEPTLSDIIALLGDNWELVADFNTDVLLKNKKYDTL